MGLDTVAIDEEFPLSIASNDQPEVIAGLEKRLEELEETRRNELKGIIAENNKTLQGKDRIIQELEAKNKALEEKPSPPPHPPPSSAPTTGTAIGAR